MYKLLLDEPPLIVLPSLAVKVGLNEAIVLQQLHYWIQQKRAKRQVENFKRGRWWVYNSYRGWREESFPFWSEVTIQRIFSGLEKSGLVIADYLAEERDDRRKWYTIDYDAYQRDVESKLPPPPEANLQPTPETTLSDWRGAPHQVDKVNPINLIASTPSDRYGPPYHSDAVNIGTKTAAEIATETAAETGACEATPAASSGRSAAADLTSLVLDLVDAGLNRADALRLAEAEPDECRRQLAYLPHVAGFKTSRGAYLRAAIEQGFAPPKGWQEARDRERDEVSRREAAATAASGFQEKQAREAARREALEAERARIEREEPERWAEMVAAAEEMLPPPLRGRTGHVAYGPALQGNIDRLLQGASAG